MRKAVLTAVIGVLAAGATARAGVSVGVDIYAGPPARVWYPEPRYERVWVPPVTQAVTQNVWHDAVTEDRVDRVWVPERCELRDVNEPDPWGRPVLVRRNVVEPGHWQETRVPAVVRPGYYGPETTLVTVQPGYWQTVDVYAPAYRGPVVVGPYPRERVYYRYDRGGRYRY